MPAQRDSGPGKWPDDEIEDQEAEGREDHRASGRSAAAIAAQQFGEQLLRRQLITRLVHVNVIGALEPLRYPAVGATGATLHARPVPEIGALVPRRLLLRRLHDLEAGRRMPLAEAAAAAAQQLAVVRSLATPDPPATPRLPPPPAPPP